MIQMNEIGYTKLSAVEVGDKSNFFICMYVSNEKKSQSFIRIDEYENLWKVRQIFRK